MSTKISKLLQQAIDCLVINDVYLHEAESRCTNGFDPKEVDKLDGLLIQQMHVVVKSEVVAVDSDLDLFRVYIRLGTRWVTSNNIEGDETDIKVFIEADFIAEYQMKESLEQECLNEFALKNASFHVWPYWREYVSSQCERMRLPRITLPAVQFIK